MPSYILQNCHWEGFPVLHAFFFRKMTLIIMLCLFISDGDDLQYVNGHYVLYQAPQVDSTEKSQDHFQTT